MGLQQRAYKRIHLPPPHFIVVSVQLVSFQGLTHSGFIANILKIHQFQSTSAKVIFVT